MTRGVFLAHRARLTAIPKRLPIRTVEPLQVELFPAEKECIVCLPVETVSARLDGLTIRSLRRDLPLAWDEQRKLLVA